MKKRIEYLDVAKGILIILMVLGHVFESGPVFQYIYSFHMPAFFIISGILFNYSSTLNKTLYENFKTKICGLIIPLLFFEIIGVLCDILRFGITLNPFGYICNTLMLDLNNGPSWFLWALFIAEMIFVCIHKLCDNKCIIVGVSICIGLTMILNRDIFPLFESTGVGFLFVTFGYYAAHFFTKNNGIFSVVIAGIVSIVSNILNGATGLGSGNFGNNVVLYIIAAISGTYLVIQVSKFRTFKLVNYFGQNTLSVVGTHQAIILLIRTYTNKAIFSVLFGVGVYLLVLILEVFIIYIFNRYIPFLIGKKKPSNNIEKLICCSAYFLIPMVILLYILKRTGYM